MDRTAEKEKPEPLLRARHWGMGSSVLWVHPTQPPSATTHLCPFLVVHSFASSGWYSWISSSQQAGAISQKQAVWPLRGGTDVAMLLPSWKGLEHLCLWVWCCETPYTLLQGVTLQHPKWVVQSWSLEIFSFSLVHGCKLMEFNALRRYLYRLRRHKEILKNRSKQGFRSRNV